MKIGHYMTGMFSQGGIGTYVHRVTEGQRERGHEVILFDRKALVSSPLLEGSELTLTRDDADLLDKARSLDVLHTHTIVDSSRRSALPAIVRTHHGHHAYCPSGSRYLTRQRMPCPRRYTLVGCAWGHVVDRCGSVRPAQFANDFRRVWEERRVLSNQSLIAVSQFTKTQLVRSGYDPSTISVVYNPAPRASFQASAPEESQVDVCFLFLGRIVAGKGLEWLIRAAVHTSAEVHFKIIGDGPAKPQLIELSRRLGVERRFKWLGWLRDQEQVANHLKATRAAIFPSLWHEPAGLVPLEAAAVARAVIASRVGGIPEYAERMGNVILVSPDDVEAMAAAITKLAKDAPLAARLGMTGWQALVDGELSLDKHLDQLEEVYLIASRQSSAAR